ncbi:MAG: hypothetical protein WKF96_08620, partial [Solirubrobacteraceae bacterium]
PNPPDPYPGAKLQDEPLVTTDGAFVRRYGGTTAAIGGLRLVTPSVFLRVLDELASGDRYRPVDLAGTDVTVNEVRGDGLSGLADRFVNHPSLERIRGLRAVIDYAAAHPEEVRLETVTVDGDPRGLVAWRVRGNEIEVLLVRATTGIGETTIGRHLLGRLRDLAIGSAIETIRIIDRHASSTVSRSFRDEGFAASERDDAEGIVAHTLQGLGTLDELRRRAAAVGSPLADSPMLASDAADMAHRAAEAERWFAPFRVVGAGIQTLVVPIQHGWATDLVDVGLAEGQLLPRPWGLGLRRELVYYRSPRNPSCVELPARLLWYVSGRAPGAGTIRAVSHLTEVAVDEHARLFHRFRPLGVYGADDVASRADARTGRAMALRFTSTERLPRPVTLAEYRKLMTGDSEDQTVVVRSIRRIPEHVFVQMISAEVELHNG